MKNLILLLIIFIPNVSQAQFWEKLSDGYGGIQPLAITASDDVFIGTWGYGVFRSEDDGDSWTSCNNGLTELFILDLVSDPSGNLFASSYDGVFRSTDSGSSWTMVNTGMELNPITYCLAVGSDNRIYAGNALGLFSSIDMGDHWIEMTSYDQSDTSNIEVIRISNSGKIYFGTSAEGLYYSVDAGETFVHQSLGVNNYPVTGIDIRSETEVIASTCYNGAEVGDGIFRTTDGGETWLPINNGLGELAVWSVIHANDEELFCGTYHQGVYHSTDNGANWTQLNSGLENLNVMNFGFSPDGYLYAATNGGMHRSLDVVLAVDEHHLANVTLENYPNPFSDNTVLRWQQSGSAHVFIELIDMTGQTVMMVDAGNRAQGRQEVRLQAEDIPSGIYICRINIGRYYLTRGMTKAEE